MVAKKPLTKKSTLKSKSVKKPVKKTLALSSSSKNTVKKSYNLLDNGPKLHVPHIKHEAQQYVAEFLGTALITFAVTLNLGYGELVLSTAVLAALVLGFLVYTIGKVSGANVNPAVTLGLFLTGNLHYKTAIFYVLAQVTGAMFAIAAYINLRLTLPAVYSVDAKTYFIMETLGAALLVFGVINVANKKVSDGASGLVVGGSLLAGIALAANYSLGILNPALAVSWQLVNYTYLLAPFCGAIIAAFFYKLLNWK
jgi:glycerol uptake facilitator protein